MIQPHDSNDSKGSQMLWIVGAMYAKYIVILECMVWTEMYSIAPKEKKNFMT